MEEDLILKEIREKKLQPYQIFHLLKEKNPQEIKTYLTPKFVKETKLSLAFLGELMIATGEVEKYLTPEAIKEFNINSNVIASLVNVTGNIKKYLLDNQNEYIFDRNFIVGDENFIVNAIKATGNIEKYLSEENIKKYNLETQDICSLVIQMKKAEEYLTIEQIEKYGFNNYDIVELIKSTGKIEEYLTPEKVKKFGLNDGNIADLVIQNGNVEEFLTKENIEKFEMNNGIGFGIGKIIIATKNINKYLTLEFIKEIGGMSRANINSLVRKSAEKEQYLLEGQQIDKNFKFSILNIIKHSKGNVQDFIKNEEFIDNYSLNFEDIKYAFPKDFFSEKESTVLQDFNAESIQSVLKANESDRAKMLEVLERLNKSNSGELRKIKSKIASQILQSSEKYEDIISMIEQIYLTPNVPEVGKRFLVFKELHPNFLGNATKSSQRESIGNIPSFNNMNPQQRTHTIFSDLLKCSIESNDRNLRFYLNTIKEGDALFNQVISGKLDIHKLPKENLKYEYLSRYASILNTLYNVSSIGKNTGEKRSNIDDLEKDLLQLDELFKNDNNIHLSLPDRIIKTFGYWAGITSMEQAESIIENTRKDAHNRNVAMAKSGKFELKKGDFIKGVKETAHFSEMLNERNSS